MKRNFVFLKSNIFFPQNTIFTILKTFYFTDNTDSYGQELLL